MKRRFVFLILILIFLSGLPACNKRTTPPAEPSVSDAHCATGMLHPEGMPPPEGYSAIEGRMLWPVEIPSDYYYKKYRFINEKGKYISDASYTKCGYSLDSKGRYQYLTAYANERADIFTMDGKKLMEIPYPCMYINICGGGRYAVAVYADTEKLRGGLDYYEYKSALYDLKTKKRLLYGDYSSISLINENIFLLSGADRENCYLFDVRKNEDKKLPAEGFAVRYYDGGMGRDFLIVARENFSSGYYGFIGPNGRWALEPVYLEAGDFSGKYAPVKVYGGVWRFIDRRGSIQDTKNYDYIYNYNTYGDEKIVFGAEIDGTHFYLDKDLNEIENEPFDNLMGELSDGIYYYSGRSYHIPEGFDNIMQVEWPVAILNGYGNTCFLNLETGESKILDRQYNYFYKYKQKSQSYKNHDSK